MLKVLTASAVLFACAAQAEGVIQCGSKTAVESALLDRGQYPQEARVGESGLWQYFLNSDSGAYSLTITRGGVSCILAVGNIGSAS